MSLINSLSDILEVEHAVKAANKGCKGDEQLSQWRVNIHEEVAADVLGSESAKVHFIESFVSYVSFTCAYTTLDG
jgi:hypothetical protein